MKYGYLIGGPRDLSKVALTSNEMSKPEQYLCFVVSEPFSFYAQAGFPIEGPMPVGKRVYYRRYYTVDDGQTWIYVYDDSQ